MRNLLRAELTRFLSRKITWIAFGVTLLALAGMVALFSLQTREPSAAERADAQQSYQTAHQEWADNHVQQEKDCRADPTTPKDQCAWAEPQPSDFLFQSSFADMAPSLLIAATAFLGLAAAVVGSSLIGADFSSGAMANWLSFVPVRWRVYTSRMVLAILGPTALSAVIAAAALGGFGLIVTLQQGAAAVTGWPDVWGRYGRAVALMALGALLGATIAFLTRRTIAAVGIVFGYFVFQLVFGSLVMQTTWYSKIVPWLPEWNALALLNADATYEVPHQTVTPAGTSVEYTQMTLHWQHGVVYLVVAAAVLVAAALLTFRRRDVT